MYKRSVDQGRTWSPLAKLVEAPAAAAAGLSAGLCGHPAVVGNAVPVQLRPGSPPSQHPGRILVPHMHNNYAAWIVHSDDDGVTWSAPRQLPNVVNSSAGGPDCNRNMTYFGLNLTTTSSLLAWAEYSGLGIRLLRVSGVPRRVVGAALLDASMWLVRC